MKICLDVRYKTEGGASSYIRNLVPFLRKYGKEHEFFFVAYPGKKLDFLLPNDRIFYSPSKNEIAQFLWDIFFLPRKMEEFRIDIYHPLKSPGPPRLKCKTVYTIHSITHGYKGTFPTSPKRYLYDIFYTNRFIRNADRIIAISKFIWNFLVDSFQLSPDKIDLIYHGIAQEFDLIGQEEIERCRKTRKLPRQYILSVGNITPVKNHLSVVKAFARIANKFQESLVIVGGKSDHYFKRVRQEVANLGLEQRVFFPGFVAGKDLAVIMNGAKILVMPSLTEGLPVSMLESMRCGLPVVASRRGGLEELGESFALFIEDPMDDASLAERISELLDSQKLLDEKRSLALAEAKRYTWEASAKAHLKTYNHVFYHGNRSSE